MIPITDLWIKYSVYMELSRDAHKNGSGEVEAYWAGKADACKECIEMLKNVKKPCKTGILARLGKIYHHYFNTKGENK